MGNLFGTQKKKTRITEQDKAILQLKKQRDMLKQYQKRIEAVMDKDRELARKLLQGGMKERAKLLLKKKRYQEQLLQRTDGQLSNVEQLVNDLEFTQVEMKVLDSLKLGNQSLKEIQKLFTIEDVERIMDETREGIEKQQEIDDLLSGALTAEDEESVQAELDSIIMASLPDVPQISKEPERETAEADLNLPEVPEEEPQIPVKQKDKKEHEPVALLA